MEAIFNREIILNKTLCRIIGVFIFVIFTALGAFVRVPLPFTPVPITLQTFFVLLSAASLGANLGALTQLVYISLGISGIPVFSGAASGLLYLFGPTGGYIAGFVLAALIAGRLIRRSKGGLFSIFGILFFADLVILSLGSIWLKFLLGYSLNKALLAGFLPFIPGDILKVLVAAIIYSRSKERIDEVFA